MMDNIAAQLSQVLSNPQAMSQIQNIAASFGLGGGDTSSTNNAPEYTSDIHTNQQQNYSQNNQPAPDNNDTDNQDGFNPEILMNMLGSLLGGSNNNNASQEQSTESSLPFNVNTLITMQKAMSAFNTSNKNVELLKALKPHLSDARKKKIDDAVKIMQLINVLPLIKESGLFDLGGD
ncbi:MAG: hypothetical protein RR205_05030 [Oscillospiraceae bacterium]